MTNQEYVNNLRESEMDSRREGHFDSADYFRQIADAVEEHGFMNVLACEAPYMSLMVENASLRTAEIKNQEVP